jgi:type I restriction enzyme S subunit
MNNRLKFRIWDSCSLSDCDGTHEARSLSRVEGKGNVPELRFPGFSGEWVEKRLGELNLTISDGNYGELYPKSSEMKSSGIPFIRANNLKNMEIVWEDMKFIDQKLHLELKSGHLEYGDILVTTRGDIGVLAYVSKEFHGANINAQICLLRSGDNISSKYLLNYLSKESVCNQFKSLQTGSALKQLPKKNLNKIKLNIPSLPEQQKIANFLTEVDNKIQSLTQKKEALTQFKKGLLQKLFPPSTGSGAKSVPELRFPGFSGEWVEKRLGEVVANKGGTSLESCVTLEGDYKFISIGNYSVEGKYLDNGQRINAIGKALNKKLNKDNLVMVLNDKTASGELIGASILIEKNETYIYNQRSERLVCNKDVFPKLLWFILNSKSFRKKIVEISQGGTQIYVNFPSVKKLKLHLPSLPEQQKIADFLTTVDNKITQVDQQIETVTQFKKGLLQQMFVCRCLKRLQEISRGLINE